MNLRKLRWAILAYACFDLFFGGICGGFLPLTPLTAAQFTTVSGTVTDPNGLPYANGTIMATLVSSGSPTLGGLPYTPPTQPTGLSTAGSFTMLLADVTALSPGGSTWSFTVSCAAGCVPAAGGKGPITFTVTGVSISGASQSITATLTAAAPALAFSGGGGLAQNGTNTAPSYSFAAAPTVGMYFDPAVYAFWSLFTSHGDGGGVAVISDNAAGSSPAFCLKKNGVTGQVCLGMAGFAGDFVGGSTTGDVILTDSVAGSTIDLNSAGPIILNASGTLQLLTVAGGISLGTALGAQHLVFSTTAPTISSGFGAGATIVAGTTTTNTIGFQLNTGAASASGVIGLPTASSGWICTCDDLTTIGANQFRCHQTASSTSSCTIGNYTSAGASGNWVANDILNVTAVAR
jgi:hypothetical protein